MIIDVERDDNVRAYFSSFDSYHYALSGPSQSDTANWEQWWLPNVKFTESLLSEIDGNTDSATSESSESGSSASGSAGTSTNGGSTSYDEQMADILAAIAKSLEKTNQKKRDRILSVNQSIVI